MHFYTINEELWKMAMEQDRLLKFFNTKGMDNPYYSICRHYEELSHRICEQILPGAERTVALRKLMESRDYIIRAVSEMPINEQECR